MSSVNISNFRHLNWDVCYNIRDLGGYPTVDRQTTRWRSILRGDNLCRLNRQGMEAVLDYGVCTIIDLRSRSELITAPHPFSYRNLPEGFPVYLHLPVLKEKDRSAMAALKKAQSNVEAYPLMLDRFKDNIGLVMRAVAAAQEGAILIHCHAGKDRTGLISALILSLAGVPRQVIAEDYAESDRYLQPLYQQILESGPDDPLERQRRSDAMLAKPEIMLHALDYLDQEYHGVSAYLEKAGVSKADQVKIRTRLVEI
jgi:protein-tyrosine phosphatase